MNEPPVAIDWGEAEVDPNPEGKFRLSVPLTTNAPPTFDRYLERVFEQRADEARGGQWAPPVAQGTEIHVSDVIEGSQRPLREFLDECVRLADHWRQRERSEAAQRGEVMRTEKATADETAERMTEEIRRPPE